MRVVEKSQLMSATEIDRTIQRLAHEIVEKSGGTSNLGLIGIRRRGVPLAQRIVRAMRGIDGVQVPVGTLDITLYRDDLSKVAPHPVLQSSDIPFPVDDKDLISAPGDDQWIHNLPDGIIRRAALRLREQRNAIATHALMELYQLVNGGPR